MTTETEKTLLAVGLSFAALAAAIPPFVAPKFREVFESFGAELPLITTLFVQYDFILWLLPVLVLAAWFYWPKKQRRALVSCVIGAISFTVIISAFVVAMYLPIFQLGTTS
jgi:type II secretory pathway component PulF